MTADNPIIQLRPYRESDLPDLLEIAVAAWTPIFASFAELLGPALFDQLYPAWREDKRQQIRSACRGEHGAVVVVAALDDRPVGFASYYLDHPSGCGELSDNAVHPDYQGRGIGTQLYDHVLAAMREAGIAYAKVTTGGDPSHAPARRAYEKAGFRRGIPSVTYYQAL